LRAAQSAASTPHFSAAACSSRVRAVAPNSRMRWKFFTTEREPSVYWSP
jgi:hypothetical protein